MADTVGGVRTTFAVESDRTLRGFSEVFDVGTASADDGAALKLIEKIDFGQKCIFLPEKIKFGQL